MPADPSSKTRIRRRKPVTLWAMANQFHLTACVGWTRRGLIEQAEKETGETWAWLRKTGQRAVKVTMLEVRRGQ